MMPVVMLDGCRAHDVDSLHSREISPLFIPPHSSHVFQPTDASLFSALKNKYNVQFSLLDFNLKDDSIPNLSKITESFVSIIDAIKTTTSNYRLIKASFDVLG